MNKPASPMERMHRRFGGWNIPSVVLGMLLVAAVLWLLPRRVRDVVLVDGADRWAAAEAPPRRQILWRPAESIDVGVAEGVAADSLVRPQLADGGLSLYYTLKRPDAEADIYRSRFDGGRWLPGEPVAELNSTAGDYGPVLSADGRSLFLYSDRPGGQGGYDLFVSQRTADGWSAPVNLGPTVNTPAHEYDPAVSPDGTRLFFASNRTPDMVRRLAAAAAAGTPPTWNATLRAEVPLQQFDIHSAAYDAVADGWKAATPLPGINTPASNEGEPCISPDGAFLYFTSDRPNGSGAVPNYDVYRVRLAAPGLAAVETIGAGVNTAANEHDPAFSPEGFRLVFSSDRDGGAAPHPDRYGLYASLATETVDESAWSTAHLSPLARHWWWIVLLALLAGLAASLLWYVRDRARRRAPVPMFFLVSLVVHVLMLLGAFFVPIEGVTVAERIQQRIEKFVATEVLLESSPGKPADAAPAFEQVASLQPVETAAVTPAPRQTLTDPTMPLPVQRPVSEFAAALSSEQVSERATADGPVATLEVADPRVLRRQQVVDAMVAKVEVEIAPTTPIQPAPAESAAPTETVQPQRAAPAQRVEAVALQPVEVAATAPTQPTREPVAVEKSAAAATTPTTPAAADVSLPRAARPANPALPSPAAETIAVTTPAAPAKPVPAAVSGVEVSIDRTAAAQAMPPGPATLPATAVLTADAVIQPDRGVDLARPAAAQPESSATAKPPVAVALSRAARVAPAPMPVPGIDTVAVVQTPAAAATAASAAAAPTAVAVDVARSSAAEAAKPVAAQPVALAVPVPATAVKPAGIADIGRPEAARPELRLGSASLPMVRQKARAASLLYAQDAIGLQQMLRERAGDDGQKRQLIEQFGGRVDTLEAISRGLHWLALVQWDDGHWDLHDFPAGPAGEKYSGMGRTKSPTAATALALLPFLGDGHTPVTGRYRRMVERGIDWLVKNQKPTGDLYVGPPGEAYMYSHGIATIALCEAFGMSKEERLQKPAQAAVDFIVRAQHAEGGWRYKPGEPGDLSVMGWQLMALKSAQMAGLAVPTDTLDKARTWLGKARKGSEFCYTPGRQNSPAMTAEGLLCMEYLGTKRDAPEITDTVAFLVERLPSKSGKEPSYYAYYGTQALFHVQGEPWRKWNAAMSDTLLSTQVPAGPHQGTWDPTDGWEQSGGRIYSTSLRLLMLEVYFRHLPLYQALQ